MPNDQTSTLPSPSILWDVDGTLVDSEPLHEWALLKTLEEEGVLPPANLHTQLLGLSAEAIHALFLRQFGIRRTFVEWLDRRWELYLEEASTIQPRAGALEAFEAAEALGWRQGVVSNASRVVVMANLHAVGLAERMKVIISADDVKNPKPHPEPYLLAQEYLALKPGAVFAVEDSAVGTRSAMAANCQTFLWPQTNQTHIEGANIVTGSPSALWEAIYRLAQAF